MTVFFTLWHPAGFGHVRCAQTRRIVILVIWIMLTSLSAPAGHVLRILLEIPLGRVVILHAAPRLITLLRLVVQSIHILD